MFLFTFCDSVIRGVLHIFPYKMKKNLLKLFQTGVLGVTPSNLIKSTVRISPTKSEVQICDQVFDSNLKFHVFGFGKAVYGMASALVDILNCRISDGVIIVPELVADLPKIQTFVGGKNNLPDKDSIAATEAILSSISTIPDDDVIIILISGGGSSLLCKPVPGLTLEDKLLTIRQLVQAGADIRELNTVRKILSVVKGGGLGKLLGRRKTVCLILSDVVGDPLDLIASGPTVGNSDGCDTALAVIQKHKLELKVPKHVMNIIRSPDITSEIGDCVINRIIGSNVIALKSMLDNSQGVPKILVSSSVEGKFMFPMNLKKKTVFSPQGLVSDIARMYLKMTEAILNLLTTHDSGKFVANMRELLRGGLIVQNDQDLINRLLSIAQDPLMAGLILLMGGETTVKVTGSGVGGRNQELAVLFSQLLYDAKQNNEELFADWKVTLLSGGTDGIDGPTDAAGAFGCVKLISQAREQGLDVDAYLNNNDSHSFLSAVDDGKYLIKTGHTGTNVMDLHLLAIYKENL